MPTKKPMMTMKSVEHVVKLVLFRNTMKVKMTLNTIERHRATLSVEVEEVFKWMIRGERWEVRGERWEVRGERWEVRGERWEVVGERWEVRGERNRQEELILVRGERWEVRSIS
jgi:hypothetical protein